MTSTPRSRAPSRAGATADPAIERSTRRLGPEAPAEEAAAARSPTDLVVARIVSRLPAGSGRGRRPTPRIGSSRGAAQPPTGDFIQARPPAFGAIEPSSSIAAHAQRRGRAKLKALEKGGGSAATEAAVLAGLRYLKGIQKRGGHWGRNTRHEKYGDFRLGKTGLALLAYLGSGHTHEEKGEFQETVQRGIAWLIERQGRNGHFGDSAAYGHGIATYALAEAYAMTRDGRLRLPLRKAVNRILDAQSTSRNRSKNGGWSYYYRDLERTHDRWPRMSVSVWQIMALKSARIGGIGIPNEVFDRARAYVENSHDEQLRAFRYNHDPEWLENAYPTLPGTTPAALFALQLLGGKRDTRGYRTGLAYIDQRPVMQSWRRYSDRQFATLGLSNLYYLYYGTLALFFEGGDRWTQWNERLTSLLVENQSGDGSWRPISYYAEYAADGNEDRAYTTAMSVLMLEVYYRYFTPLLTSMEDEK